MVELRVNCRWKKEDNNISVLEYKGKTQHGIAIHFDSLWRKRDSLFFVNGKEDGQCLFWDTLGNIVGRKSYRKGKYVGVMEFYWEPGRPSVLKHYNAQGKEEGPWKQWWRNGNPRVDFIAKNGRIISGTEYYPNGSPRVRFETKYSPKLEPLFKRKRINAEAWAPNGKSTGRIIEGNGEWTHFSEVPDSVTGRYGVFREVYKDSRMILGEELDSAEIAQWLK